MSSKVLNNIGEVAVELGLVLIELVVIFIKAVVDVWNELLKSLWNRTFFEFASAPVPRFQNINVNCGEEQ